MKKLFFILLLCFIAVPLCGQSFIECPTLMQKDTLYTVNNSATQYIFFNNKNDSTTKIDNHGCVDLDVYPTMESTASGSDTLNISMKGFKLKRREGNTSGGVGQVETLYSDTVSVNSAVPVDSTLHTFAIERLFDSTFFPMYDGLAVTFYKNGSDADSVNIWTNLKIYKPYK